MPRVFDDPEEERTYLKQVKAELDGCKTKDEVAELWKRHYLKVGHKKLGRLLVGRTVDSAMSRRGKSGEE